MFTIVTIYNDKNFFERVLSDSLKKQTADFELIAIDNTKGKYKSAAHAFNVEASDPKGDYILFVHQDVDFGGDGNWLTELENFIKGLVDVGVVGVVGLDFNGILRGFISDCGQKIGKQEDAAVEVQTVDELLFVIPKGVFKEAKFDALNFDGWHLYGADYSLMARKKGLKTYVVPFFVFHRSLRKNVLDIYKYQMRLFLKHRSNIFATTGTINRAALFKGFVKKSILPIYQFVSPDWITLLKKEADHYKSILDLGCGYNSPIQSLDIKKKWELKHSLII